MKTNHFALAFAFGSLVTACGGVEEADVAEDTAGAEDAITIYPLDLCKIAAPDATANMGFGSASKLYADLYSGSIDYSNTSRSCRRFVADIIILASHQTPNGWSDFIDLNAASVGSTPGTKAACEAIVVNARFYERTDTMQYSGGLLTWSKGSFASIGSARLEGVWVTNSDVLAPGCYVWQVSGAFPATTAPSSPLQRRVARIAVEGHVETANGNVYGLSVKAGAHHAVSFGF